MDTQAMNKPGIAQASLAQGEADETPGNKPGRLHKLPLKSRIGGQRRPATGGTDHADAGCVRHPISDPLAFTTLNAGIKWSESSEPNTSHSCHK
jgi:hypothetical protein